MATQMIRGAVGFGMLACLLGCVRTPSVVPEALQVPTTQHLSLVGYAVGLQIYECQARKDGVHSFEWAFQAPEAVLYDDRGSRIGRHYAGPTWEAADGSAVVGEVIAKYSGPDLSAIPWLLLRSKSTSGKGVFSGIQSVQRLDTVGGKAPADGCDANRAGMEVRVPYKAKYYFYSAKA